MIIGGGLIVVVATGNGGNCCVGRGSIRFRHRDT